VLQRLIKQYGDLQIAIQDQEFFNHSPNVYFHITERSSCDISPYSVDEPLDEKFIAIVG